MLASNLCNQFFDQHIILLVWAKFKKKKVFGGKFMVYGG
jgi:hypothetical protein